MSNRDNSQPPSSANIEIVQNQLIINWETVGDVSVQDRDKFKLKMPKDIPASPGVYRIIAAQSGQAYIGEGKNLSKRLRDYQNAGYRPDRKAATNRSVQGWIYTLLEENSDSVQISICRKASVISNNDLATELDFEQKYFRMLVESLTIFNHKDLILLNKQF